MRSCSRWFDSMRVFSSWSISAKWASFLPSISFSLRMLSLMVYCIFSFCWIWPSITFSVLPISNLRDRISSWSVMFNSCSLSYFFLKIYSVFATDFFFVRVGEGATSTYSLSCWSWNAKSSSPSSSVALSSSSSLSLLWEDSEPEFSNCLFKSFSFS